MYKIIDGNKACAKVASYLSEISFIYPITPSSPMASLVDSNASNKIKNVFNDITKVIEMQSEAGAAGSLHGAMLAGSLGTTFTSSQGLLLMIPNMYKMAGEMLPAVIHVAARTVATHALSIFGDHSDVYATRQTGFCMLASSSVEDAYNLAMVAHLSAIKGSLPFLHFFDGFRTSHEINKFNAINLEDIKPLLPVNELSAFRKRSLNVGCGFQKGMAENEDIYFQSVEARNKVYEAMPDIVNDYMREINKLANTSYAPFEYYGSKTAKNIIVAMGSITDTIKLVIDEELKNGNELGLIIVRLYRPFSTKYLLNVLPSSVENIAVIDRTKEAGSTGEPLYLDIINALKDKNINIVGGRYGLSSKNTTPANIKSIYDMLATNLKNNFTIGINDDVTNLSLEEPNYTIDLKTTELKICGFGSDGMVSASKEILSIVGRSENTFVQGYSEYDSKKSGGVTIAHLRISDKQIKAPYYVTNPNLIVITKDDYLHSYNMLDGIKENGILLLSTNKETSELVDFLPNKVKKIIKTKNIKVYIINAEAIAEKNKIKGKISKIMESVILKMLDIPNYEEILKENITTVFKTKGEEIINANLNAINEAISNVHLVEADFDYNDNEEIKAESIIERIRRRKGNELSVSELAEFKDGTFPWGTSNDEKRGIAKSVAKWVPENCIQCGQCSFYCPHAVIRTIASEDKSIGIPLLGDKENKYNFVVSISEKDCTNCLLCERTCPGKGGNKAITFGPVDETLQEQADKLFESQTNPNLFDKFTIKGSQFEKCKFEFSGACAGCGETPYIKLLTQLFGDRLVIANATGCTSIYGGSVPSTPYTIPWANSLFEDNAEFGYGINMAYKNIRNRIACIMQNNLNKVTADVTGLFNKYLENSNDFDETIKIKEELSNKEIPTELKDLIDYIPSRSVWMLGGDGWAYDIGFGGIDHVLSSNENVNILVLDSEVYSNTGGQASKSSNLGQLAEFADMGKKTVKKDLFRIAMSYPNCYVASINMGANMMQTLKAFKEAEAHNGPSIIIAYSTCVEHGIKGGMSNSIEEQKLLAESGYTLMMRYNPTEEKLYLDSREPDFTKFSSVLENETRYRALKIKDENLANSLQEEQKKQAIKRYEYYKNIIENQKN